MWCIGIIFQDVLAKNLLDLFIQGNNLVFQQDSLDIALTRQLFLFYCIVPQIIDLFFHGIFTLLQLLC